MKTVSFIVNITFDEEITERTSITEVLKNVHNGLISQCNDGDGLAPEETNALTKEIETVEISTNLSLTYIVS